MIDDTPAQETSECERLLDEIGPSILRGDSFDREGFLGAHAGLRRELEAGLDAYDALRSDLGVVASALAGSVGPPKTLGDYEIVRPIARGAMGSVYEARCRTGGEDVALKILPPLRALDPANLLRFRREAGAAASVRHRGLVRVRGLAESNGVHFLVMDHVRGRCLEDLLREMRDGNPEAWAALPPLPDARCRATWAARVVLDIAEALHEAHEKGIVHRDVKPANIVIGEDGRPVVMDFGLAWMDEGTALTATREFVGTPRYAAPEQLDRDAIDRRADIYSLGITLYEILSLRPAFPERTLARIVGAIREGGPLPLRRVDASVPKTLETIVLGATAIDPARRYPDCRAMSADLGRFLERRGPSPRSRLRAVSLRARRFGRAHRRVLVPAAAALAALAIAGVTFLFVSERDASSALRRSRLARLESASRLLADPEREPEAGFPALVDAWGPLSGDESAQQVALEAGRTMRDRGIGAAARQWTERLLRFARGAPVRAAAQRLLGDLALERLDGTAAREHWDAAIRLDDAGASGDGGWTRAIRDVATPGIPDLAAACGTAGPHAGAWNVECADLDGDGRDEIVSTDIPSDRQASASVWSFDLRGQPRVRLVPIRAAGLHGARSASVISRFRARKGPDAVIFEFRADPGPDARSPPDRWLGAFRSRRDDDGLEAFEPVWLWKERAPSIQAARAGDLDGDGIPDCVLMTDDPRERLVALLGRTGGRTEIVTQGTSGLRGSDVDLRCLEVTDLDGDGRDDVAVAIAGHEIFGVVQLGYDGRALERIGPDLAAGSCHGCAASTVEARGLLVAQGIAPARADLVAGSVADVPTGPGLRRFAMGPRPSCVGDCGRQDAKCRFAAAAAWAAFEDPAERRGADGAAIALARLLVLERFADLGTTTRSHALVSITRGRETRSWFIPGDVRRFLLADLVGGAAPQIVLLRDGRLTVLGVGKSDERAEAPSGPEVSTRPLGSDSHRGGERERTAARLMRLALARDSGRSERAAILRECLEALAEAGRSSLASTLLDADEEDPVLDRPSATALRGDLALVSGEWNDAVVEAPAGRGLRKVDALDPARRRALTQWLRGPDAAPGAWHPVRPEDAESPEAPVGACAALADPAGALGGRYGAGRARRILELSLAGAGPEVVSIPGRFVGLAPRTTGESWNGATPLRLRARVLVSRLDYGLCMEVGMRGTDTASGPRTAGARRPPLALELAHVRSGAFADGDRYRARLASDGLSDDDFAQASRNREFPLGVWLDIDWVVLPELGLAVAEVRREDRRGADARVSRLLAHGVAPLPGSAFQPVLVVRALDPGAVASCARVFVERLEVAILEP